MHTHYNCDALAARLIDLGRLGASLPPAWNGAKITHLVAGPQGEFIGKMLPGKGLLLCDDLKNYGILTPLPHVFERSLTFRLRDLLKSERGAITTYAGLHTALVGRTHGPHASPFSKNVIQVTGRWASSFTQAGVPGAGTYTAIPGGAAHSQLTTGALNYAFAEPTSPDKAFLLSFGMGGINAGFTTGILVDLLVGAGNIDSNVNTAQTVNTTALTRNTSGAGVMVFFEVTSILFNAAASTLTINKYTNQAGTTLQTSPANAMILSAAVPQLAHSTTAPFFALASGDYGVRSVEEVTFSAAMGGTGTVACVLCMPLMWIPGLPLGFHAQRDDTTNINGAKELAQTSGSLVGCLSLLTNGGGNVTTQYNGELQIAVGS